MPDPDGLARWKRALAANAAQKRQRGKRAAPRTGAGMVRLMPPEKPVRDDGKGER